MKTVLLLSVIFGLTANYSEAKEPRQTQNASNTIVLANDTCKRINTYLLKLSAEKNFSGGLLIVKGGKRIFSKGYGYSDKDKKIPFTPNTLASIGSITKAFTASAVMKLVEQNKLSLGDSLKKFFPDVPADKASITIHQLLTHSSGFHEFIQNDGGDYEKIDKADFLKRAFAEPLAFKPGAKAVYTNVGMSILGIIIEQISGLDYEVFLRNNLFEPIGIKNIGYHYPASPKETIAVGYHDGKRWGTHQERFAQAGGGPFWNLKANGGLEASLHEMYLWINSFTNYTILKKSSIQAMFTPHIREEGNGGEAFFGYGCNISQSRRNTTMIVNGGSNGIYFARIVRLPKEDVVFYMVTNESAVNTSMVLPNVTQLYFQGKIEQDAMTMRPKFENELSKKVYDILEKPSATSVEAEFAKENIAVEDDMILLEVGQTFLQENKIEKALMLYTFYTKTFPKIVVAWIDLGDVYRRKNDNANAKRCYEEALRLRPTAERAKKALAELK